MPFPLNAHRRDWLNFQVLALSGPLLRHVALLADAFRVWLCRPLFGPTPRGPPGYFSKFMPMAAGCSSPGSNAFWLPRRTPTKIYRRPFNGLHCNWLRLCKEFLEASCRWLASQLAHAFVAITNIRASSHMYDDVIMSCSVASCIFWAVFSEPHLAWIGLSSCEESLIRTND